MWTKMKKNTKKSKPVAPPTQNPNIPKLWRDMPLEVRIREAYNPLYLKRYE
jgi:hypothetical protein